MTKLASLMQHMTVNWNMDGIYQAIHSDIWRTGWTGVVGFRYVYPQWGTRKTKPRRGAASGETEIAQINWIVETYWHDHSLESSWGVLSDGTISFLFIHFLADNFLKKPQLMSNTLFMKLKLKSVVNSASPRKKWFTGVQPIQLVASSAWYVTFSELWIIYQSYHYSIGLLPCMASPKWSPSVASIV
jgi:hypothetical protein